ncbi:hypothetical protein FPV67DRAFT_1575000 [Lyophyllum atratum]|nr:hypothetical protein FPV67DRAFT_1575000 [Lyophyllum atratum]
MGRDSSIREPPGVEHLYPDEDSPRIVMLVVSSMGNESVLPSHRHWAIAWRVGTASTNDHVHRQLEVTRERGPYGPLDHLTNWGPKTRIAGPQADTDATFIPIATLSYAQRQWLERVAAAEQVLKPNGWWNCQHWVVSVLVKCIQEGLIAREPVQALLSQADWNAPLPM